jgi:hypothetical protein
MFNALNPFTRRRKTRRHRKNRRNTRRRLMRGG